LWILGGKKDRSKTNFILKKKTKFSMILITGGLGFIGSSLVKKLLEKGQEITIIDNSFNKDSEKRKKIIENGNVRFLNKDVREKIELDHVDLIYHLAAQISVGNSFKDPALDADINVKGTLNMLELARKNNCPFVFASSSTVYGKADTPTTENSALNPISPYGISKLCAEKYCRLYALEYNVPITIFRIFNVYGPGGFKGVIPDFIRKLETNPKKLEILGDGKQTKDYIFIDDVVNAFVNFKQGTFNLGSGTKISVLDLADLVIDSMGLKGVKIETGHKNWPGDVKVTQADINKLKKTGWEAKVKIGDGIKRTVNWHLK
jgi:UDP-glucose 4-epimerase